ncbi:response regulator transcription factor [Allomuricauda sp. d1]|uniref:response regulator n=1 Tax=Allomuricauda sp. d1 TaxID=3136725 RepID=UPI0031CDB836
MERKDILLVEDDDMMAALLGHWLEKEGYAVTTLKNGLQVKEALCESLPDLIISDIMMPYYSGIELVDHIRNELKLELPVILISAASNDENVMNAFELGANDFISKPISPHELLVRVARTLKTMKA